MAPDLRGHGDSEWAKGSSYSLTDNVYDLTRLMRFAELKDAVIVGHSMGGMIALAYAGTYPEGVSRLVVLDGAFLSGSQPAPIAEQMSRWIDQLDRISAYQPSAFRTIEEAAKRLSARNKRLTPALALHLARHGVRPRSGTGLATGGVAANEGDVVRRGLSRLQRADNDPERVESRPDDRMLQKYAHGDGPEMCPAI